LVEAMAAMSKYAVFFTLKGEAIARAMEQPSDRCSQAFTLSSIGVPLPRSA